MSNVTHESILKSEANYWRIEANHSYSQWERAMEDLEKYRWRPIETAPLNHWVLLSDKSGFVWMIIFTREYKNYTKATHWMPLPTPPVQ